MKRKKRFVRRSSVRKAKFLQTLFILFALIFSLFVYLKVSGGRTVVDSHKTEMKKLPKSLEKQVLAASTSATLTVPILMYHYVEFVRDRGDTIRISLNITPPTFEAQVKTLKEAGYTFITARDLGNVLDGEATLPQKPVILTFDDGYRDFYTDVFPILKKYNVHATAYIISGFVGRLNYMNEDETAEIIKSGLVEIGAHTVHHVSIKGQSSNIVNKEVRQSKKDLEEKFHTHIFSFAYPNGSFDEQALSVVKDAGFTTAVTTIPGNKVSNLTRLFIYRLRPGARVGEGLIKRLNQNFRPY